MIVIYSLTVLLAGILFTSFGLLVIYKKGKKYVNRLFGILSLSYAIWSFAWFIMLLSQNENTALFFARLLNFGATLIPVFYFHWILTLIGLLKKREKIIKIGYIITFIFLLVNFSDLYISDVHSVFFIPFWPTPGPVYILFIFVSFFGMIGYAFFEMSRVYLKVTGFFKSQLEYVIIGSLIAFVGGSINFLVMYKINIFSPVVLFFESLLLIASTAVFTYAVVKHRLMDVKIIILRTITYSIVVLTISSTVVGFTLLIPELIEANTTTKAIIAIITSIFIVIILEPLKRAIAKLTDKLFFKAGVDYQKLLSSLSEVINREIDLDLLLYSMSRKLEHNLKIKNVSIFLAGSVGGAYYKRKGRIDPKTGKKIEDENGDESALDYEHRLKHDSNIVEYLRQSKDIVVLESLERKIEDTQDDKKRKILEQSKEELDKLDASVVAPVTVGKELTGIMVFGPKLSGDPYGSEDINLLQLIGPQLASALEKSRLYEEAKQFTERLKKEIELATMHLQDTNIQLQDANKHLQQLDQAKSEFVSITSHQLRTPMTGIMGYISMILQGDFGKVPAVQKKILTELLEESQRMIRIINLFLNVSKIESGKMELNLEPIQIEDVVAKILAMVQQPAAEKGLKLIYKKPSKLLPKVMGDKDKLGDIVLNFTDNAIKYTDKGSVILTTEVDGKFMHFAVKDSGRGIEKEEAKKLFTKFVRGFGIAQINPDGSGLGLYVARRLAEAHKGKIWVDSEGLGKGATFNVTIPLAKDVKPKK